MCPYKGNLPPEYELVHQFTVYQVEKRSKIIMSNNSQHSILTRYGQMCPYKGNLPTEYEFVHELIVYQVGKRSKIIMPNNLSLTTLNPDKVRSNVSIQRQHTS